MIKNPKNRFGLSLSLSRMTKVGGLLILAMIFIIQNTSALNVSVWQGQYYTGTTFNEGTFGFNFTIYDNLTGGNTCYSNKTNLTTGTWGNWETEQQGVSEVCNNASEEYYLNINIAGTDETPRRRLTIFDFLRKDAVETMNENITFKGILFGSSNITFGSDIDWNGVASTSNFNLSSYNLTSTGTGFFSFLGDLSNRITKIFSTNLTVTETAEIEALQIKRYDSFGPVILLNNTADAIRFYLL